MTARDQPRTGAREQLASALVAITAGLALGLPPDVWPETGLLGAVLLLIALALGPVVVRPALVLSVVGFAVCNVAISLAPGRSIETMLRMGLVFLAFCAARSIPRENVRWIGWSLASVGAMLGVYALGQKLFFLADQAELARELALSDAVVARLERGRAFATHGLPASLAGGLTLALAAGLALVASVRSTLERVLWMTCSAAIVAGILVSASVGAALALVVAAGFGLVFFGSQTLDKRRLAAGVVLVIVLLATVTALRPRSLLDLDRPDHPVTQRVGNWRGAALTALEQPVVGTGLGSFGSLYPQVRRVDDSQTVYAHNSWLQLAVEGGLPALGLLALLVSSLGLAYRRSKSLAEQAVLFGLTAFAVHNLWDFTGYLAGVAVPAFVLAASWIGRSETTASSQSSTLARWTLVAAAVLVCLGWMGESAARRQLDAARASALEGQADVAAQHAARALDHATWSPKLQLMAATALGPADSSRAGRALIRLTEWDPRSPAGWHALGDLRAQQSRLTEAWVDYEQAKRRHPHDPVLQEKTRQMRDALSAVGVLDRSTQASRPLPSDPPAFDWSGWDDILLLVALSILLFVGVRWARPGPAPAALIALLAALLLSMWGQGGAFPGVRLGRQLLIGFAFVTTIWNPLTGQIPLRLERWPVVWLTPIAIWAAFSAWLAPSSAAARDGLSGLIGYLLACCLSYAFARSYPAWPKLATTVVGFGACLVASCWMLQRALLFFGVNLSQAPYPLRLETVRPAADFLHPGHLGTFLLAVGLAWVGSAIVSESPRAIWRQPVVWVGSLLIVVGLAGGARSSLVALAAGGCVLLWHALRGGRAAALKVASGLAAAGVIGFGVVLTRFQSFDPFAWSRPRIWRASFEALSERFAWGFGPSGFASLGPEHAFAEPEMLARYGKVFRGAHSDPISLALQLGVVGAVIVAVVLCAFLFRAVAASRTRPELIGVLAGLAALGAHGLVDDFVGSRPAIALLFAVWLGAAAGSSSGERTFVAPGRFSRWVLLIALGSGLFAGELIPWAADRAVRAGEGALARSIDARRSAFLLEGVGSSPAPKIVDATLDSLDLATRARLASPASAEAYKTLAIEFDRACRGAIPDRSICRAARDHWSATLARRPYDVHARRARARLALYQGAVRTGTIDLKHALSYEPNFLAARLDLVAALFEMGDTQTALREWDAFTARFEDVGRADVHSPYQRSLIELSHPELFRVQSMVDAARGKDAQSAPRPADPERVD